MSNMEVTAEEAARLTGGAVGAEGASEDPKPKAKKKSGKSPAKKLVAEKREKGSLSKRKTAKLKKINKGGRERAAKSYKKKKGDAPPRKPGPAMTSKWLKKMRSKRTVGECFVKGCKAKPHGRAKFCSPHKKQIRKDQLKANNKVWRARVKKGEAGHHVVYDGRATKFSTKDTQAARRIVSDGHSIIKKVTEFDKLVAETKNELRAKPKATKKKAA